MLEIESRSSGRKRVAACMAILVAMNIVIGVALELAWPSFERRPFMGELIGNGQAGEFRRWVLHALFVSSFLLGTLSSMWLKPQRKVPAVILGLIVMLASGLIFYFSPSAEGSASKWSVVRVGAANHILFFIAFVVLHAVAFIGSIAMALSVFHKPQPWRGD